MAIKNKILDKIKKEEVKPTSEGYFIARKYVKIGLLILLVFFWIFITTLFISDFWENMRYFNFRYFHFPLLWIIIIWLVGFFAFKDFQKTDKGYKYPVWWIVWIIFLVFIISGLIGFRLGVWHNMNNFMWSHMSWYRDFTLGQRMWQNPSEWRMWGIIENIEWDKITISNFRWDKFIITLSWSTNTGSLSVWDRIKVIWEKTGTGEFIATEIITWIDNMWPSMMRGNWRWKIDWR